MCQQFSGEADRQSKQKVISDQLEVLLNIRGKMEILRWGYVFLAGIVTCILYDSTSAVQFSRHPKLSSGERLDRLENRCRNLNLKFSDLKAYERKYTFQHILVNDENRILYCYIPKVACSNWKRVMMVLDGRANDTDAIPKVNHTSFKSLASYSSTDISYRLQNYYKFLFVREPLDRLVSAYKDKLTGDNEYYEKVVVRPIIAKYRIKYKKGPAKGLTLEEFFLSLKSTHPSFMDEHWMPIYQMCQPCAVSYDFIGTLENVEEDSKEVLNEMSVTHKVMFPRKQEMYLKRNGPSTKELLDQIPRQLLKAIVFKYKKDYELFSYDIPQF